MRDLVQVHIICLVGLSTFAMGGLVFGFSSLYPVLYRENVFANTCNKDDDSCGIDESCCASQRLWLAAMASCSLFAADGVMVIYGEVNDRMGGPITCLVIGAVLVIFGLQIIAIAVSLNQLINLNFFIGLMCMGLGGPGIFMGCLGFGAYDTKIEPMVTAVSAAAWDSSSIIFLLFATLYSSHSFAPLLGLWSMVSLLLALCTGWQLMRMQTKCHLSQPLLVAEEQNIREVHENNNNHDDSLNNEYDEEGMTSISKKKEPSLRMLLLRGDTVRLLSFMAIYNLKSAFYIESISDQIRTSLNISERAARQLDLTFNLAFPIGGFTTSLASAAVLENNDDANVFLKVACLANLFSIIQLLPHQIPQYTAALLFGPARTLQWAAYFHFLMTRYPAKDSGRLIGYGNLVIAIIGDGLPYALTAFVNNNSIPGSSSLKYIVIHTFLALCILIASFITLSFFRRHSPPHLQYPNHSYLPLPNNEEQEEESKQTATFAEPTSSSSRQSNSLTSLSTSTTSTKDENHYDTQITQQSATPQVRR